jgi:hypothetical protein
MPKAETKLVRWAGDPGEFRGDIGASTRIDGERWREGGAQFQERDDGQGESPMLAVGTVQTVVGDVEFGILDYGEGGTYLLAPTSGGALPILTAVIAEGLEKAGVISIAEDLEEEESPYQGEEEILERIAALEQFAGEYLAETKISMVPIATKIAVPGQVEELPAPGEVSSEPAGSFPADHIGTLKWLRDKERAVISPEDGSAEVVVEGNLNMIVGKLPEGTRVSYRYGIIEATKRELRETGGADYENAAYGERLLGGIKRYDEQSIGKVLRPAVKKERAE